MKTVEEILRHIDEYYAFLLERPWMYAENPKTLEAIIFELESLRDFITEERIPGSRFTDYTHSLGYATAASLLPVPGEPSPPVDEAGCRALIVVRNGVALPSLPIERKRVSTLASVTPRSIRPETSPRLKWGSCAVGPP